MCVVIFVYRDNSTVKCNLVCACVSYLNSKSEFLSKRLLLLELMGFIGEDSDLTCTNIICFYI